MNFKMNNKLRYFIRIYEIFFDLWDAYKTYDNHQ